MAGARNCHGHPMPPLPAGSLQASLSLTLAQAIIWSAQGAFSRVACLPTCGRWQEGAPLVSSHAWRSPPARGTLVRSHGARQVLIMFDLCAKVGAEAWQRLASPILVKFMIVGACGCVVNSAVLSITYGLAHIALPVAGVVWFAVGVVGDCLVNRRGGL